MVTYSYKERNTPQIQNTKYHPKDSGEIEESLDKSIKELISFGRLKIDILFVRHGLRNT